MSIDAKNVVSETNTSTRALLCHTAERPLQSFIEVKSAEDVLTLPAEYQSGISKRPLRYVDEYGEEHIYYLNSMSQVAIFILVVECLERFSYYGINFSQTAYLTGEYNFNWNAGFSSIEASSYVSTSTAIAYTAPFLGAILADSILGDYWTILFGVWALYLPGMILIALTTVPHLFGSTFNFVSLDFGMLFLWPVGTGIIKSVVNVFGAKQFHPVVQKSSMEEYFLNFYMSINIGALVGGILVPFIAQRNVTIGYTFATFAMFCSVLCFISGTSRYVRLQPRRSLRSWFASEDQHSLQILSAEEQQMQTAGTKNEQKSGILTVVMVTGLILPFSIVYNQMATTFIIQGTVMQKAFGFVDASEMNNADTISVLLFGNIITRLILPAFASRGIKVPTNYKFAAGTSLGALAILSSIVIEHNIKKHYFETGDKISILWQVFPYMFIGAGEILSFAAALEIAFVIAPAEDKALASAANLFIQGGFSSVLCLGLYNICSPFFYNDIGTADITDIDTYVTANLQNYFWLLFAIGIFGVVINLLPPVSRWLKSIEESKATTKDSFIDSDSLLNDTFSESETMNIH